MPQTPDLDSAVAAILDRRGRTATQRSLLVGVSGIDASGKGYISQQLIPRLWRHSVHAVCINVDGWLNLPHIRFDLNEPAEHFYQSAIRFDEMFRDLVLPLRDSRSCHVTTDYVTETATEYEKRTYEFSDVDVIVLEGIFLFKNDYVRHFDLRIWIDCSFETALSRALARQQEQLPAAETIRAYETIYFPAQRLHFRRDCPRENAHVRLPNDEPSHKQEYSVSFG